MFVTFEGMDGAGKTAQVMRLNATLKFMERDVVVTREPGGTPYGEQVRRWLINNDEIGDLAKAFLFNSSRAHLIETVVSPALERGAIVLCDRFFDSTVAYQGLTSSRSPSFYERLCNYAVSGVHPDVTVYLRVDPYEAARRVAKRDGNVDQDLSFFEDVGKAYDRLAKLHDSRFVRVDGMGEAYEVAERVWDAIRRKMPEAFELNGNPC